MSLFGGMDVASLSQDLFDKAFGYCSRMKILEIFALSNNMYQLVKVNIVRILMVMIF